MAFCSSCGAPVTAEASRCGRCEASLQPKAAPRAEGNARLKRTMMMGAAQVQLPKRPTPGAGAAASATPPAPAAPSAPQASRPPAAGSQQPAAGGSVRPEGPTSRPPAVAMPATAPGQRFKGTLLMGAVGTPPAPGAEPAPGYGQRSTDPAPGSSSSGPPAAAVVSTEADTQPIPASTRAAQPAPSLGGTTQPTPASLGARLTPPADDRFPGDVPTRRSGAAVLIVGLIVAVLAVTLVLLLR